MLYCLFWWKLKPLAQAGSFPLGEVMGTAQCRHWQQLCLTKTVAAAQPIRRLFQRDLKDCKYWLLASLAGAQRERREAQEKWSLLLSLFPITPKNETLAGKYLKFFFKAAHSNKKTHSQDTLKWKPSKPLIADTSTFA